MAQRNPNQRSLIGALVAIVVVIMALTGCSAVMAMVHGGPEKPAESEFGLGPRTSSQGLYTATLQPDESLRPRKLQTIQVVLKDAQGRVVDGAAITIDGGMPQHGHGLPTRPRVTKSLGNGVYVIEGVRFNMGGWWEFKLAIQGSAGTDSITFNLAL
ncbi:MAG TPA: FixH family protein [Thermoanaerobaculia bacterium]